MQLAGGAGDRPPQPVQNIVRRLDDLCAILQQAVGSAVPARQDAAGHRHDVPALFQGASGGNQRPALLRGFDDDDGQRDPADDPVAQREMLREAAARQGPARSPKPRV